MRIVVVALVLTLAACGESEEVTEAKKMCMKFYNIAEATMEAKHNGQTKSMLENTTDHPNLLRVVDLAFEDEHKDKAPAVFAHWIYNDCMDEHLGSD